MTRPLVSIVMPCRNAGPWIGEAVRSCLEQSWQNLELIVVDNGSTDESMAVAGAYASPKVKLLACERPGASAARNDGLAAAQGDFIQHLDADDHLHPCKIAIQLDRLRECSHGTVASGAWARSVNDSANAAFRPEPVWRDMSATEFLISSWRGGGMMPPMVWLAPREVVERSGSWNEELTLNDDGEYFARVLLASGRIAFCGDAKSFYRTLPVHSLSKRTDREARISELKSIELSSAHLLSADWSASARHACAAHFQRFIYGTYPESPDLIASAERQARDLGGSDLPCPGGPAFQMLSSFVGWKRARRVQLLARWMRARMRNSITSSLVA